MNKVLLFIIFLVIIFILKSKIETYQDVFIPSNDRILINNENVSININLDKLKVNIEKMNKMIECIDCHLENKSCEINCEELFLMTELNFYKMIIVLYETYINEFQDIYLINRFNINKYLNITYQIPNDNYNELILLYNNLKTNIEFLNNNINNNLFLKLFELTNEDIGTNLQLLEETYNSISSNRTFIISDVNIIINNLINNYLQNILSINNNLFNVNKFDINKDNLIYFTIKDIDENNLIDIIEAIERMLENEINESQNLLNS